MKIKKISGTGENFYNHHHFYFFITFQTLSSSSTFSFVMNFLDGDGMFWTFYTF
jgi:hypothetical protein